MIAAHAAGFCGHRVPTAPRPLQSCEGGIPSMLPGFRFLFAAVVLSVSVLVFGLGVGALLRAAHEQFASIPLRQTPPEPLLAQRIDTTQPALAMLRADPPAAPQTAS